MRTRGLGISQVWPPVQGSCPTGFVETVVYETGIVGGLAVSMPVTRCVPASGTRALPRRVICPTGMQPCADAPTRCCGTPGHEVIAPPENGEWVDGVPNWLLLAGAGAALWFFGGRTKG